jgi:hypothetical protein
LLIASFFTESNQDRAYISGSGVLLLLLVDVDGVDDVVFVACCFVLFEKMIACMILQCAILFIRDVILLADWHIIVAVRDGVDAPTGLGSQCNGGSCANLGSNNIGSSSPMALVPLPILSSRCLRRWKPRPGSPMPCVLLSHFNLRS